MEIIISKFITPLEISKAMLFGFTLLYLYHALINLSLRQVQVKQEKDLSIIRFLFSLFCALFAASQFIISFSNSDLQTVANNLFWIWNAGLLVYIYYAKLLSKYLAGGKVFYRTFLGLMYLTFVVHVVSYIASISFEGVDYFLFVESSQYNGEVLHSIYGFHKQIPTPLITIVRLLSLVCQLSLFTAMIIGRIKKRYTDNTILFGVILSTLTIFYEIITAAAFPNYFIFVAFLANFPEVYRTTLLAKTRQINDLIEQKHQLEYIMQLKKKDAEIKHFKSIGNLASGVAHEINNPLMIISSALSRVKREFHDQELKNNDKVSSLFSKIDNSSHRISEIVKRLSLLSYEYSDDKEDESITDISELAIKKLYSIIPSKDLILVKTTINTETSIYCNKSQIVIALYEILLNAQRAALQSSEKSVELLVTESREWIVFSVLDSGNGIVDSIQESCLAPYSVTNVTDNGYGLGLSVVNSIVLKHRGALTFDDVDNLTKVSIQFPKSNLLQ